MARNPEKDREAEAKRKQQILDAGFRLFSEHGIEAVSMNAVAAAAGVGSTTLFNYYQTKEKLVVSISGMVWGRIWRDELEKMEQENPQHTSAYGMIRRYTNCMIRLYREQPEVLRFSSDYKTFICRQHTGVEELKEHLDPLQPIQVMFHKMYIQAKTDHSIRTDLPEDVLFTTVAIGMLSIAERYAQGIVWANNGEEDHTRELQAVQKMILAWCAEGTKAA